MGKDYFWHINYECNSNCVYCHTPPDECKNSPYTIEEARERIKEFKKNKIAILKISGGEPTLHKNITEIVKSAKSANIKRVELVTNGIALGDKNFTRKLKEAGLDMAIISFPSHLEKIFNLTRDSEEDAFRNTIRGIYNCFKEGIEVGIVHVVYEKNYRYLHYLVEAINKNLKNIVFLNFSLVSPAGRSESKKSIVPNYTKLKPYLQEAMKRCVEYKIMFDVSSVVPLCLVEGYETHCSSTRFIIYNYILVEDSDKIMSVNAIKQQKYKNLNKNIAEKAPQCKKCSLDSICAGFFPGYAKIWGYSDFIPLKKSLSGIVNKIKAATTMP